MKKTLLIVLASGFLSSGLLFGSFFERVRSAFGMETTSCKTQCDKDFESCKKNIQESGSFNYYKCFTAHKECTSNCPTQQ